LLDYMIIMHNYSSLGSHKQISGKTLTYILSIEK